MICPVCGGSTKVTWTLTSSNWSRRRRHCKSCGYKFNTGEVNGTLLHNIKEILIRCVDDQNKPMLSYKDLKALLAILDQLPDVFVENDHIEEDRNEGTE